MKASQILERTAEKYANCLNYCDSGLVEFDTPDDLHETICFRTRFERPSLFTFEWQDYGPNRGKTEEYSLLWSVNGEAETVYRWGNREKTMANPLSQAIAGATGASAGAAHLISSLLIEDVGGLKILELDEAVLLDHPDSKEYFIFQSIRDGGFDSLTLWIERDEFAVRKVERIISYSEEDIDKQLRKLEEEASAKGLRPPRRDVEYHSKNWLTRYTYETVEFDTEPALIER